MITLLLAACVVGDTTQISVSGRLYDSPDADAGIVAGASVAALDAYGVEVDTATADDSGTFEVEVVSWDVFHLHLSADGYATTAWAGTAGESDIAADEGVLWLRSETDLDALRATYSSCPSVQDEGGVVEGVMRLYIPGQEDNDTLPLVTTGVVTAWTVDGVAYPACYLDAKGASDPDATSTGETGNFAVFGVPSGPISVELGYTTYGTTAESGWYFVWLPDDGVAPMHPALVEGL
jgi:hypothetical protein